MSQFARAYPDDYERRMADKVEDRRQPRIDAIVQKFLASQEAEEGEDG